jgi:uncharacterized membrane protein YhaH (DUF805 family)
MDFKSFYFSFEGRIGRQDFWLRYMLPYLGIFFVIGVVEALNESMGLALNLVLTLALIWPTLAVNAKRWHDRDKSGWWMLINVIPIVGFFWALVETGFLRGTVGANRFGPDPLSTGIAYAPAE